MTIGQFSTITHISVRTLRRYHEAGLLEPEHVDTHSGYRRYTTRQVATAQVIRRFRDLDMPVRDIARLLATGDVEERSALIADHLTSLRERLAATGQAVAALQRLLAPSPERLQVLYRRERARWVTAVEGDVELDGILDWYSAAMVEIDEAIELGGARPTGPPGGLYDNALFTDGAGHATVFVPTDREVVSGRVHRAELPERELALTVHHGDHEDIDLTYGALGTYLAEHALVVDGPVHETYLVGPRDSPDSGDWRTEIGWPIFTTAR
jgi:DNA-binding transcriptional MerR regulator/effector-binding domain-containing protein